MSVLYLTERDTVAFESARTAVDIVCAGDRLTGWNNFGPTWQWPFRTYPDFLHERCAPLGLRVANGGITGEINARLATAIRGSAPQHTIMTSGPNWGGIDGLQKLKLLPDKNIVYSFHSYDPFPFTHQGATWSAERVRPLGGVPYPSSPEAVAPLLPTLADMPDSRQMLESYGNERWNKERLVARFQRGIEWGARHGVPLYCGEFGVIPDHPRPEHRANWFRDFGQILAEHRIGWAVWDWEGGFGLGRRYVDGKPQVDQVVVRALGLRTG